MNQSSKESGAPWYVRIIFWLQRRHYGEVLNSARLWAKSPRVFLGLSFLYGALDRKTSPYIPPDQVSYHRQGFPAEWLRFLHRPQYICPLKEGRSDGKNQRA